MKAYRRLREWPTYAGVASATLATILGASIAALVLLLTLFSIFGSPNHAQLRIVPRSLILCTGGRQRAPSTNALFGPTTQAIEIDVVAGQIRLMPYSAAIGPLSTSLASLLVADANHSHVYALGSANDIGVGIALIVAFDGADLQSRALRESSLLSSPISKQRVYSLASNRKLITPLQPIYGSLRYWMTRTLFLYTRRRRK